MKKEINAEAKTSPHPSRISLYAKAADNAMRMIEILKEIAETGDNDSARLGAAKTLLSKALPDITAQEIAGKDGQPIFTYRIDLASGFIPRLDSITSTSGNGITESHQIQSPSVAPESKEDNHSVN